MHSLISNFLPEESQMFFKPSKAAQPRLRSIGYSNACAAMCGNVTNLSSEEKQAVSKVLVGFRHTFTRKSSLTWNQGSLMLKSVQFTFRSCLTVTYNIGHVARSVVLRCGEVLDCCLWMSASKEKQKQNNM